MELILKDEVYAVVGAAIKVHRVLGPGFLEPVYQEALEIESGARTLPFKAQLSGKEEAQILNYLKVTGYKVGVLINFGSYPKLEWKRFIY